MRSTLARIVISSLTLLLANSAVAEFATCNMDQEEFQEFRGGKNYAELAAAYVNECSLSSDMLGESRIFIERIRSAESGQRGAAVGQALTLIGALLDDLSKTNSEIDPEALTELRSALQCDIDSLGSDLDTLSCDNNVPIAGSGTLPVDKWRPRLNIGAVFEGVFAEPLRARKPSCLAAEVGTDPECETTFTDSLLPLLEFQGIMHSQIVPLSNSQAAEEIVEYYDSSHEKWKNYLAHTGLQYPWELTINKWRNGGFEEIARRQEAPRSRLIVLHPTIGLAYSDNAPDGEQVDIVGIVKLFGYKRWRYRSNKPSHTWGVSLTSTFADIPQVDDSGIGVLLEYNQFGLGFSKHGSDDIITMNIDLSAVLSDRPQSVSEWLGLLENN